ncbi:MAG: hypothetical protein ACLFP4_04965 [Spirochaetales bacterium]
MGVLLFLLVVGLYGLLGLMTWAGAELPIILREIALNTRNGAEGPAYKMVNVLAVALKIFAVVIWVAALIIGVFVLIGGANMGGFGFM